MRDSRKQKERPTVHSNAERNENKVLDKEEEKKHPFILVVKSPFRDYQKGHHIVESQEIDKVLSCHEASAVLKVKNK